MLYRQRNRGRSQNFPSFCDYGAGDSLSSSGEKVQLLFKCLKKLGNFLIDLALGFVEIQRELMMAEQA